MRFSLQEAPRYCDVFVYKTTDASDGSISYTCESIYRDSQPPGCTMELLARFDCWSTASYICNLLKDAADAATTKGDKMRDDVSDEAYVHRCVHKTVKGINGVVYVANMNATLDWDKFTCQPVARCNTFLEARKLELILEQEAGLMIDLGVEAADASGEG